jgi:hypothetical protein
MKLKIEKGFTINKNEAEAKAKHEMSEVVETTMSAAL